MLAAAVCWSFGGLLIKYIPWDPMTIVGIRSLLAAIVFIVYNRNLRVKFTTGTVLSALCLCGTTVLYVFANKLTTAAAAILLQFCAPVFIIIFELIFKGKKPKPAELLTVALTLSGMVLFFIERLESGGALGNALAILSGVSFAGMFVCNKRADTDSGQGMLLGFLFNAVIGLPFAFFGATADVTAWAAILFLGIVQVGIAYLLFAIGIKKTPALLACLITAVEPILNPVWVAVFTDERPGGFALLGGVVIVTAVVGYNIYVEKQKRST